jgi:hypothetical protein
MSNKEIGDIYRGIRRQEKYEKPEKLEDMYGEVIREASVVFNYDDGSSETVEISDKNAKSLRGLSNTSVTRADMLVRTGGENWVGTRGHEYANQMLEQMRKMEDWKKIDDRIITIGKQATIFDEAKKVLGSDSNINAIRAFLIDSARATLEAQGKPTNKYSVKSEVAMILTNIESGKYQQVLIDNLQARCGAADGEIDEGLTCTFPLWDVVLPGEMAGTIFAVDKHPDMLVLRPYTDEAATRGAAGPGEALISFIYGGIKPRGAGDILLNSAPGDSIELKKQKGRVGKDIKMDAQRKKYISSLFYPKSKIKKSLDDVYRNKWTNFSGTALEPGDKLCQLPFPLPPSVYETYISKSGQPEGEIDVNTGKEDPTGITVFPKSLINKINAGVKVKNDQNANVNEIAAQHREDLARAGFTNKKGEGTITGDRSGGLKGELIAGTFKDESKEHLLKMPVQEFVNKASGVIKGKYGEEGDDGLISVPGVDKEEVYNLSVDVSGYKNAWDCISQCPGITPMDKIGNLIGVYHLKYYLTHIQSFRWLVVYDPEGTAAGISHAKVVQTPIMDLLEQMHAKGMYFGIRKDNQGFDIQVDTGMQGE